MKKEDLDKFSDPIVNIYTSMERDLLVNMAAQLKDKKALLEIDPEAWRLQQLQNLGILDQQNLRIIRDKAGLTSSQLNGLLYGAGLEGLNQNEEEIQKAIKKGAHLKVPVPIGRSTAIYRILKSYENQAQNTLNLTNAALLKNTNQAYKDIINRTALQAMSGTITGEEALRSTIRQWGEKGIPALITANGSRLGPEGYVRTVITSTANNVVNDMQRERFNQYAVQYIEISSHAGNRPGCVPYAGKIFSLDPENTELYPYLYDPGVGRIGAPDSLFGINCGHYQFPFFPGLSTQRYFPNAEPENTRVYEESQRQRLLERRIRSAKTQKEMLLANGDVKGAADVDKLIRARQKTMRGFIEDSGRTRRRYREQIVSTSGLREAASKAPKPMPIPKAMQTVKGSSSVPQMPIPKIQSGNKGAIGSAISTAADIHNAKLLMGSKQSAKVATGTSAVRKPTFETLDLDSFETITYSDKMIKDHTEWLKTLDDKERKAIRTYTSNDYAYINKALRNDKVKDSEFKDDIKTLKKTLSNAPPLTKNITVTRGITNKGLEPMFGKEIGEIVMDALRGSRTSEALALKRLENAIITDKAFMSSSYVKGGWSGDIQVDIKLPKGYKNGAFVESLSEFSSEREYLVNAGTKLRIVGIEFKDGKAYIITTPMD